MGKYFLLAMFALAALSCIQPSQQTFKPVRTQDSHYEFVKLDTAGLGCRETWYVPVYSEIYHHSGESRFQLTSTISVRNLSLSDSAYVIGAVYNDSYGKPLRTYTSQIIALKPLESIEFVVEDKEDKGGAGASFLIDWGSKDPDHQVLIQSVMIGSASQQGISFVCNGVCIRKGITKK